jgi:hypothetical protein
MNPTDPTGATDPTTDADLETKLRRTFQAVERASLGAGSADVAALPRLSLRSMTDGRRGLTVVTLSVAAAVAAFVALFIIYGPQSGGPTPKTTPAGQSPPLPAKNTTVPTTNVLFTHVSPDGSRVVAKRSTCAPTRKGYLTCGRPRHGLPAIEFDVTRHGHHFQEAVLSSYVSDICGESGIMNPMFTSQVGSFNSRIANDMIVLCVHPPAVKVVLPRTPASGPSPRGDQMTPVDGLVVFPINNTNSLDRPLAFDNSGKVIGTSLPFPCC